MNDVNNNRMQNLNGDNNNELNTNGMIEVNANNIIPQTSNNVANNYNTNNIEPNNGTNINLNSNTIPTSINNNGMNNLNYNTNGTHTNINSGMTQNSINNPTNNTGLNNNNINYNMNNNTNNVNNTTLKSANNKKINPLLIGGILAIIIVVFLLIKMLGGGNGSVVSGGTKNGTTINQNQTLSVRNKVSMYDLKVNSIEKNVKIEDKYSFPKKVKNYIKVNVTVTSKKSIMLSPLNDFTLLDSNDVEIASINMFDATINELSDNIDRKKFGENTTETGALYFETESNDIAKLKVDSATYVDYNKTTGAVYSDSFDTFYINLK